MRRLFGFVQEFLGIPVFLFHIDTYAFQFPSKSVRSLCWVVDFCAGRAGREGGGGSAAAEGQPGRCVDFPVDAGGDEAE